MPSRVPCEEGDDEVVLLDVAMSIGDALDDISILSVIEECGVDGDEDGSVDGEEE